MSTGYSEKDYSVHGQQVAQTLATTASMPQPSRVLFSSFFSRPETSLFKFGQNPCNAPIHKPYAMSYASEKYRSHRHLPPFSQIDSHLTRPEALLLFYPMLHPQFIHPLEHHCRRQLPVQALLQQFFQMAPQPWGHAVPGIQQRRCHNLDPRNVV